MALENLTGPGVFIDALVNSNPTGNDPKSEGDDHLRGIKNVLLNAFPAITGAVTVTHTRINALDAFEAGTKLPFYQSSAPAGWTQDTSVNDAMLRVVSSAGGTNGGSDSAILNNKIPTHTHGASSNTTGSHSHTLDRGSALGDGIYAAWAVTNQADTQVTRSAGSHSHTITVNNNSGGANWTPKYVNMIICSKD